MTALRWFLSYLLPMLILSSITAGYFYRDQISSDWYRTLSWPVAQINAVLQQQKLQLNTVESVQAADVKSEIEPKLKQEIVKVKPNKVNPSKVVSELKFLDESDTVTMTSDVQAIDNINSKSETKATVIEEQAKMPILPKTTEIVTSTPQLTEKMPEKLAIAPPIKQYNPTYPQQWMRPPAIRYAAPRVVPKPPTQFMLNEKQQKLLYQARKAYWVKDFKKAQKLYFKLVKQLPDNPDIQGELGNLFYFDRKLESAIKHYVLAAKLLIKHRHFWKLPRIMQIVSRFNPTKTAEIMALMRNRNN